MKYWIKMHIEMLQDRKVLEMDDRLFRRMMECFLLAGEMDLDGDLPDVEDVAWKMRGLPGAVEEQIREDWEKLVELEILEKEGDLYVVKNFVKRQARMSHAEYNRRRRAERRREEYYEEDDYEDEEDGDLLPDGDRPVTDALPDSYPPVTDGNENEKDEGNGDLLPTSYPPVTIGNTDKIRKDKKRKDIYILKILSELESGMSKAAWDNWCLGLEYKELRNGKVIFSVSRKDQKLWCEKKLAKMIERAFNGSPGLAGRKAVFEVKK